MKLNSWTPTVLLVCAVGLYIMWDSFIGVYPSGIPEITLQSNISSVETFFQELGARSSWVVVTILFVFTVGAGLFFGVKNLSSSEVLLLGRRSGWVVAFCVVSILFTTIVLLDEPVFNDRSRSLQLSLLEQIPSNNKYIIPIFPTIVQTFGGVSLFGLVLGVTLILSRHDYRDPSQREEGLRDDQIRVTQMLYVSAAILVASTSEMFCIYNWVSTLAGGDEQLSKSLQYHALSVTYNQAGFYSIVLLVCFLPAFLLIHLRSVDLAKEKIRRDSGMAVSGSEIQAWLDQADLQTSFRRSFPKLLSILAPLMTGFLAEPVSGIIGGLVGS